MRKFLLGKLLCLVLLTFISNSIICYNSNTYKVYADEDLKDNENAKKLWNHIKSKGGTDWWADEKKK